MLMKDFYFLAKATFFWYSAIFNVLFLFGLEINIVHYLVLCGRNFLL